MSIKSITLPLTKTTIRTSLHQHRLQSAMTNSWLKHLVHCVAFLLWVVIIHQLLYNPNRENIKEYHPALSVILYTLHLLPLLSFPHTVSVVVGLFFFNAFEDSVELSGSPQLAPYICFRMVTRGNFPALVRANAERNRSVCLDAGLHHFMVEVVTDIPVGVPKGHHSRELVVPAGYMTKNGTLYKARALQYCLEAGVNQLMDDEWIVHLDEETLLTRKAVHGILNFINSGKYQFGQGLITYANDKVVNWLTTLADMYRIADDMGRIQGELRTLHLPISGWKGSYIVAQAGAERKVSFDYGRDSSIAEDAFFAMAAIMQGYTFNFIQGEMWEKSPFTIMDFIRQRKRWVQGIFLLVHNSQISIKTKWFVGLNFYAWVTTPVSLFSIVIRVLLCPIKPLWLAEIIAIFILATTIYMYIYGVFKSINIARYGMARFLLCLFSTLLLLPCNVAMENVAIVWGLMSHKYNFHIVDKVGQNPVVNV